MIYVKIKDILFPATINGTMNDRDWGNRESKAITVEMDYASASGLFVDGVEWSIVEQVEVETETGTEMQETEWDNSEYSLAGDIIDHRDGTITVKLGKLTELEEAYEILLGGV